MQSRIARAILLSCAPILLVACDDDDDDNPVVITTIGDSVGSLGLTTLATALDAADLTDDLNQAGPFTLFGPSNAAFAALPAGQLDDLLLPANQAELIDLLNYHVLASEQDAAALSALSSVTTAEGSDLIVDSIGTDLYLNDARVFSADTSAENGVIHQVDAVLKPPLSILDTLDDRGLTSLDAAITTAGLDAALAGAGPFTVLAPTNAAFDAVAGVTAGLTAPQLAEVLNYHVLSGSDRLSARVTAAAVPSTNANGTVVVFAEDSGAVTVNSVAVSGFNIACTNGVIHVIEEVLVTPLDIPAAATELGFSTLATALGAADLVDDLQASGPFTVFAPDNAAFDALPAGVLDDLLLPANQAALIDVLNYHVLAGAVDAATAGGLTGTTTAQGGDLVIDSINGDLFINDARVVTADVQASNGLIHAVDRVLQPPATLLDALAFQGLTQFSQALQDANLDGTFSGGGMGPFTLLAPTDAAFDALPAGFLAGLSGGQLDDLLEYHVVMGEARASDAVTAVTPASIEGSDLFFEQDGSSITVNGVAIRRFNIPYDNGIIHVIDAVLIEPDASTVATALGATTLATAITAAGLETTLDNNGPFTLLAPSNAAFDALEAANPGILSALLDPANVAELTDVLTYHVVDNANLNQGSLIATSPVTMLDGNDITVVGPSPATINGTATITLADFLIDNGQAHVIDEVLIPPGFVAPMSTLAPPTAAVPGVGSQPTAVEAFLAEVEQAGGSSLQIEALENVGATPLGTPGLVAVRAFAGLRIDATVTTIPGEVHLLLDGAHDAGVAELRVTLDGLPLALAPDRVEPRGAGTLLVWRPLAAGLATAGLDLVLDAGLRGGAAVGLLD
ncbi:MAG: fasciclin domain-containing protein [Planctomycetota bacterium]